MEQSVEIAPEFGSSALHSSLFIIFVSCCKYEFNFCKVKSVLASENDIFVNGSERRHRGRPATGCSVDSLETQKLKRTEWSGCRNPVWLTRYVHQTWKIGKEISLFKIDNDFAAHLLSLEMAKVTNWLWMNSRGFILNFNRTVCSCGSQLSIKRRNRRTNSIKHQCFALDGKNCTTVRREANKYEIKCAS